MRSAFAVFIFVFLSANCLAENTTCHCEIDLSFIKGSVEAEQGEKFDSNVLEQLKGLPFTSFSLLKKESKNVVLDQTADFVHASGGSENKVAVTPLKVEGQRVQALIEWTSATGENILSSKIWFENGKNLVFGAEQGNTRCTVLDVAIRCQR